MSKSIKAVTPEKFYEVASTCICFNLRRGARAVTQYYDNLFQAHGLRATQFTVLSALVIAEAQGDLPTISLMAEALVMDRTTLARNLKPLERDELVVIEPGDDRRTRVIRLTDHGRQKLADIIDLWDYGQTHFQAQLGANQFQMLLNNVNAAVEASQAGSPEV
jgi:DNA-binding MarR family transcriptional regulator